MYHFSIIENDSQDLHALITELDAFQTMLYPQESNHLIDLASLDEETVRCIVVRNTEGQAVGCGAVVLSAPSAGEIKRVFIKPECRGLQLGQRIMEHLENTAIDAGCTVLRLETGIHQAPAIRLYEQCGFQFCEPFAPYTADPLSVFMMKMLR